MITLGVPPRTIRPADRSIECRPACDLPRRSRSRLAQQLRWIAVLWGWR